MSDKYAYRVIWSQEDGEFVGLCAEFPSLSWLDKSQIGALKGITDLVSETVAEMAENKEKLPLPISTKNYSGNFKVRIPPMVHRNLAVEAAEEGVSLNRLVSAKLAHG